MPCSQHGGPLGAVLADVLAYEARPRPRLISIGEARPAYLAAMTWTRAILAGPTE